jgi:hypothetical protein
VQDLVDPAVAEAVNLNSKVWLADIVPTLAAFTKLPPFTLTRAVEFPDRFTCFAVVNPDTVIVPESWVELAVAFVTDEVKEEVLNATVSAPNFTALALILQCVPESLESPLIDKFKVVFAV